MERRKQRGSSSGNHEAAVADLLPHYSDVFGTSSALCYYDVHCDIAASIDYLRYGRGKAKISHKAAVTEFRTALFLATGLRAMISQTWLLKPGRPWTNPLTFDLNDDGDDEDNNDDDSYTTRARVLFVLGLSEAFQCIDDSQREEATANLLSTLVEQSDQIIAIGATLDYSQETQSQPGNQSQSQISRLQACWEAAGRGKVPFQLKLLPGAASLDPDQDSVAGTEYAKVLLDAQAQCAAATTKYPELAIHIVGWYGKAAHMMALLQAFPNNIRAIGLDGTVSFAKATEMHECAFEVPLDRLVIETSTIIPSQVNNRLGRTAFFHSGWWPFVAQSIAHHKKVVSIEQVVHAANENATKLYPLLTKYEEKLAKDAVENQVIELSS